MEVIELTNISTTLTQSVFQQDLPGRVMFLGCSVYTNGEVQNKGKCFFTMRTGEKVKVLGQSYYGNATPGVLNTSFYTGQGVDFRCSCIPYTSDTNIKCYIYVEADPILVRELRKTLGTPIPMQPHIPPVYQQLYNIADESVEIVKDTITGDGSLQTSDLRPAENIKWLVYGWGCHPNVAAAGTTDVWFYLTDGTDMVMQNDNGDDFQNVQYAGVGCRYAYGLPFTVTRNLWMRVMCNPANTKTAIHSAAVIAIPDLG